MFNNVNALIKATTEFGPHEIDPLKIVIVSHGPEIVVWAKQNYSKYKDIVDRAASLSQQGVRIEFAIMPQLRRGSNQKICRALSP